MSLCKSLCDGPADFNHDSQFGSLLQSALVRGSQHDQSAWKSVIVWRFQNSKFVSESSSHLNIHLYFVG